MSRMSISETRLEELKHYCTMMINILKILLEIFSRMDEMLDVKPESKTVGNTKKKSKARELSFAEIRITVVNKLSGLNLVQYVKLLVETAVYTAVNDVVRRTMEIITELFIYKTANQVVILTAYGLTWICILWRWRYAVMGIFQLIWYSVKKFVKKTKDRYRVLLEESEK